MARVDELLRHAGETLAPLSDTARLDAELLLARVLSCNRTWLYTWPEYEVDPDTEHRFQHLLRERGRGLPVAYLLGEREFFGHRFRVTPQTLIPRPDTELLVEVTLELLPDAQRRIADLGTGCGAVGISLALARPGWQVWITDIEPAALNVATENARWLAARNVTAKRANWLEAMPAALDAVVSNPPYVPEADPHLERGDVRHEPRGALAAGADGLDAIRAIVADAPQWLAPGGWLALEHGHDQGGAVRALMNEAGFTEIDTRRDLAGQERVTHGRNRVQ